MGYYEQSLLSQDADFYSRIAAAAAVELELDDEHPTTWAGDHQWQIAASPGFADAYSSALAGAVENPGRDTAVISDDQLRAAVVAEAAGAAEAGP